jgi:hypothetical protein
LVDGAVGLLEDEVGFLEEAAGWIELDDFLDSGLGVDTDDGNSPGFFLVVDFLLTLGEGCGLDALLVSASETGSSSRYALAGGAACFCVAPNILVIELEGPPAVLVKVEGVTLSDVPKRLLAVFGGCSVDGIGDAADWEVPPNKLFVLVFSVWFSPLNTFEEAFALWSWFPNKLLDTGGTGLFSRLGLGVWPRPPNKFEGAFVLSSLLPKRLLVGAGGAGLFSRLGLRVWFSPLNGLLEGGFGLWDRFPNILLVDVDGPGLCSRVGLGVWFSPPNILEGGIGLFSRLGFGVWFNPLNKLLDGGFEFWAWLPNKLLVVVDGAGLCSRLPNRLLAGEAGVFRDAKGFEDVDTEGLDPNKFVDGACEVPNRLVPDVVVAGADVAGVPPKLKVFVGWDAGWLKEKGVLAGFSAGAAEPKLKLGVGAGAGLGAACWPKLNIFPCFSPIPPPKLIPDVGACGWEGVLAKLNILPAGFAAGVEPKLIDGVGWAVVGGLNENIPPFWGPLFVANGFVGRI